MMILWLVGATQRFREHMVGVVVPMTRALAVNDCRFITNNGGIGASMDMWAPCPTGAPPCNALQGGVHRGGRGAMTCIAIEFQLSSVYFPLS